MMALRETVAALEVQSSSTAPHAAGSKPLAPKWSVSGTQFSARIYTPPTR